MENLLSHMGLGTKQITDRYSGDYGPPAPDQHVYYAYESSPSSHGHAVASSKHHYSGSSSGLKSNASMSALTLLAFLFFLHILQQCIKEHMTDMAAAPVVVMSASRESNDPLTKQTSKIDKTGITQFDYEDEKANTETGIATSSKNVDEGDNKMMRINAEEHKPKIDALEYVYKNGEDSSFLGYVRAMDDERN